MNKHFHIYRRNPERISKHYSALIRDFWEVTENFELANEIEEIKNRYAMSNYDIFNICLKHSFMFANCSDCNRRFLKFTNRDGVIRFHLRELQNGKPVLCQYCLAKTPIHFKNYPLPIADFDTSDRYFENTNNPKMHEDEDIDF